MMHKFMLYLFLLAGLLPPQKGKSQPGSYTLGFSFDLYDSSKEIEATDNSYTFHWQTNEAEDLVYTTNFENCNNHYPSLKKHNHCVESHTIRQYQFIIIRNSIDSMLLTIEFPPFPMDNQYRIDTLLYQIGNFETSINELTKETLDLKP